MSDDMDKVRDFAAKIANDVNEGIDCNETRRQLREAIRFFAMDACAQHSWRSLEQSKVLTCRVVITILLTLLKGNRSKAAKDARRMAEIAIKL